MKIVYVSRSIIPSRTANSVNVMRMCNAFADLGHEVTLLAPWTKKLEEKGIEDVFEYYGVEKNFTLKKLYAPNIKYLKKRIYSIRCLYEVKKIAADLVYGRDDMFAFYLADISGYKVLFEKHEPLGQNSFDDYFFKKMVMERDRVRLIFNSGALKNIYHTKFNVPLEKMFAAHNGANEAPDDKIPDGLMLDKGKAHVGYIGTLFKGRGIDVIIELAKRIPSAVFHVVGGKEKDLEYWREHAKYDNLIFHGFVEPQEAYKYRNMCNILLAPYQTDKEGNRSSEYMSPIKLFEYMSSKRAIITSDLSVVHEFLDKNNSVLVDPLDIDAWEDALNNLIRDKNLREKIAAQAEKDFLNRFTWKARVNNILEFVSLK